MYIKQITISGFKSYRDLVTIDSFSPRNNVIVGRNGSGKSNFFMAIQFLLSEEFGFLKSNQRLNMIHEGSGDRQLSAYVEVIFDNSDNRIPIEKNEIIIRRVISSKQDQFFLDKKHISKNEIINLFESAGFSRCNPYYIVKQGKINEIATSLDSQRLKILKEVAGTKVFDDNRTESESLMKEALEKQKKVNELLEEVQHRVSLLETDKEDLREFHKCDRLRRSLEYAIFTGDANENDRKRENLNQKRRELAVEYQKLQIRLQQTEDSVIISSRQVKEADMEISLMREERDIIMMENSERTRSRAKTELELVDIEEEMKLGEELRCNLMRDQTQISLDIRIVEEKLTKILPVFEDLCRREESLLLRHDEAESKIRELYGKEGRAKQFSTIEERDLWIDRELCQLRRIEKDKLKQISDLEREIQLDSSKRTELELKITETEERILSQRSLIENGESKVRELKRKGDELQTERCSLWRQENVIRQGMDRIKEELEEKQQLMRNICGKTVLDGIDSVLKVVQQIGSEYFYGTIIDNIDCSESLYTAVEVTAGSRLFYIIVKSDQVATQILNEMNRQKMPGEVTFIPLNKISRIESTLCPEGATHLIDLIKFQEEFRIAFENVFKKTLLCKNMDQAIQFANSMGCDCVTCDGDQIRARGPLIGGFYDSRKSKIGLNKTIKTVRTKFTEMQDKSAQLKNKLTETERDFNICVGELQICEARNSKYRDILEKMNSELTLLRNEFPSTLSKTQLMESAKRDHQAVTNRIESLISEIATPLLSQLAVDDVSEIERLGDVVRKTSEENRVVMKERMELEVEKNRLESNLQNNLTVKRSQLEGKIAEIDSTIKTERIEQLKRELNRIDSAILTEKQKITEMDQKMGELTLMESREELNRAKIRETELRKQIDKVGKSLEGISTKQKMLLKRKEECLEKVRKLGTIPFEDGDKYSDQSLHQLYKLLDDCNIKLKQYNHVNKKALDQFSEIAATREGLLLRQHNLNESQKSIMDLMNNLDANKYEALNQTFEQVSDNFTEIFKTLVPGGNASLIMKNSNGLEATQSSAFNTQFSDNSQNHFMGVGIQVSFGGDGMEMRDMNQLSGGQKSLVALTFIFAIQKCDPAPFYLFDEIDQALDPQHRQAVTEMIGDLSKNAQFITTTFRPELIENADMTYKVNFQNKVSTISSITKEEALDFVED